MNVYLHHRISLSHTLADLWRAVREGRRRDVEILRERLEQQHGGDRALALGSGRQALLAALMQVEEGAPVIVPAYGCPIVAATVTASGREPVFVDVDPGTLAIDTSLLESAVEGRAGAVVLVHEFGRLPTRQETAAVRAACSGPFIEDAALTLGASYDDGRPAGSEADAVVFSGSLAKPLGAATWGLAIFRDPERDTPCVDPGGYGWAGLLKCAIAQTLQSPWLYGVLRPLILRAVAEDADRVQPDLASASAFDSSLLLQQLPRLDRLRRRRWRNASRLIRLLESRGFGTISFPEQTPLLNRLPFWTRSEGHRERLIERAADVGIELGTPFQKSLTATRDGSWPVAERAIRCVTAIAVRETMSEAVFSELASILD